MSMRLACILIPALLAGCAAQGEYPSLAKRPIEKGETTSTSPPPPAIPSDPALLARIDTAVKQAKDGVPAFEAALPASREMVQRGAGAAEGSDAWISGQMGASRLERTVIPARDALSALDAERTPAIGRGNAEDIARLEAAIAEVEAIVDRQAGEVNRLLAMLKS